MVSDLNYTIGYGNHTLQLTGSSDTPELLKRGITLMLFNQDPAIRNFNGTSIVNAFPTITQAGFDAVNFNLSIAAARIAEILKETYPEVSGVYFSSSEDSGKLSVSMTIETISGDTQTAVVYGE